MEKKYKRQKAKMSFGCYRLKRQIKDAISVGCFAFQDTVMCVTEGFQRFTAFHNFQVPKQGLNCVQPKLGVFDVAVKIPPRQFREHFFCFILVLFSFPNQD